MVTYYTGRRGCGPAGKAPAQAALPQRQRPADAADVLPRGGGGPYENVSSAPGGMRPAAKKQISGSREPAGRTSSAWGRGFGQKKKGGDE